MKTLIVAAAAALMTAPAFAGTISAADFATQHFAQSHTEGDGPRGEAIAEGGDVVVSTMNGVSDAEGFAYDHFAQSRETGDGPRVLIERGDVVVSTKGGDVAGFAAAHLANGPEDKR